MPSSKNIEEFLKLAETHPIVDVRTPAEFEQGHIVGAYNIPLFSDEERKVIGTLYKQKGKEAAIQKGLEMVNPRLDDYIQQAKKIRNEGAILMHCWRGGMRSASMAWLFELYGYKTITLRGGYKSYRRHVLDNFSHARNLLILGGKTGSGKTLILHELKKLGEQVIDLEALAHHKGSSFGSLGEKKQPSQEQFENELCFQLSQLDPVKKCWLENESRKIGVNVLPEKLWEQMRTSTVLNIDIPVEERVRYLVEEYGKFNRSELISATERITRHLGGQHAKRAIEAISEGDLKTACEISLVYYDKTYSYGVEQRPKEKLIHIPFDKLDVKHIGSSLKKYREEHF